MKVFTKCQTEALDLSVGSLVAFGPFGEACYLTFVDARASPNKVLAACKHRGEVEPLTKEVTQCFVKSFLLSPRLEF